MGNETKEVVNAVTGISDARLRSVMKVLAVAGDKAAANVARETLDGDHHDAAVTAGEWRLLGHGVRLLQRELERRARERTSDGSNRSNTSSNDGA